MRLSGERVENVGMFCLQVWEQLAGLGLKVWSGLVLEKAGDGFCRIGACFLDDGFLDWFDGVEKVEITLV